MIVMNSQAYVKVASQHVKLKNEAIKPDNEMLDSIVNYCEMRYWMELSKEMVIDGDAKQFSGFVGLIGSLERAMAISSLVQMERCGMVVTLDKYNSFMQMEVTGHDHQGHAAGDAGQ